MGIDQEILQRLEEERAKPAARRIGSLQKGSLKHVDEKVLRQILGVGDGVTAPADEGEDRSPIHLAEIGQGLLIFRAAGIGAGGRQHDAPARGIEAIVTTLGIGRRFGGHTGAY